MTTAVPLNLLDPAARSALTGYRNLLHNARFWINQRAYAGAATTAAKQYTHDRWRVVVAGQAAAFSDTMGASIGWMVTAPAGGLEQVVERINFIAGQFVLTWQGSATATVNGATVQKGVPFSVGGGADMVVRFSGGSVMVPQLERGTVPTEFEILPYPFDLLQCQRYYLRQTVNGQSATAGNVLANMNFPTMMRAMPSAAIVFAGTTEGASVPGGVAGVTPMSAYLPFAATAANGYVIGLVVAFDAEIN